MWDIVMKGFGAILHPLLKSKVTELAKTAAVRQAIFEEQVKLRLECYVHAGKLDKHRSQGMAQEIIAEFRGKLNFDKVDPKSEDVRTLTPLNSIELL